jgi:next-to-BRCA1 protein 1
MSAIIVKAVYKDDMRRFSVQDSNLTYANILKQVVSRFGLKDPRSFVLKYKDEENDLVTVVSDEDLQEAVLSLGSAEPRVLRLSVVQVDKEESANSKPFDSLPSDLRKALNDIGLSEDQIKNGVAPEAIAQMMQQAAAHIPQLMQFLPIIMSRFAPPGRSCGPCPAGPSSGSSSGTSPSNGMSFHPGVECDACGMHPIVGVRYKSTVRDNFDLCESCKSSPQAADDNNYVALPPPVQMTPPPFPFHPPFHPSVHHGVTCDGCGMRPLVGVRYKSTVKDDYDLCESCKNSKAATDNNYTVVPPSAPWAGRRGPCGPMRGGHCGRWRGACGRNVHAQGQGQGKLMARFVKDLSIFDGTQMPPGTNFTKMWRMRNHGTAPWPAGTRLMFVGGDRMGAPEFVVLQTGDSEVQPDQEVDVSVDLQAPGRLGRYEGFFRLASPVGKRFGQRVWVSIRVVDPAVAPEANLDVEEPVKERQLGEGPADEDDDFDEEEAEAVLVAPELQKAVSEQMDVQSDAAAAAPQEPEPIKVDQPVHVAVPVPVAAPVSEGPSDSVLGQVEDGLKQLASMGFDRSDLVEQVLRKNNGSVNNAALELLKLRAYDNQLNDLDEMGFHDRELNRRLLLQYEGNIKLVVRDLVKEVTDTVMVSH